MVISIYLHHVFDSFPVDTWHYINGNTTLYNVISTLKQQLVSTGLFLSCHIHILKWIYNLQLLEYQGTPLTSRKFCVKNSLTFRQLQCVDLPWNAYVTWYEHTFKCTVQISTQNTSRLVWLKCLSIHLRTK